MHRPRRFRAIVVAAVAAVAALTAAPQVASATTPEELRDQINRFRCVSGSNPSAAVRVTCQDSDLGQFYLPDTEPTVAVNPYFPDHIVIGSRAFFPPESGEQKMNTRLRYSTSFDGGRHWIQGQVPIFDHNSSSYPSVAFVKARSSRTNPARSLILMGGKMVRGIDVPPYEGAEVGVSRSTDGGRTWSTPIKVFTGNRYFDKPWVTVDDHPSSPHYGRAYLTAVGFLYGSQGLAEFPIFFSYSDDSGLTWSQPKIISGSHPSCTAQRSGNDTQCDEDVFGITAVAPDGTVYVHFANFQNASAWETSDDMDTQLMVVRSADGGETFSDPVPVVQLENGQSDMPWAYYLVGPKRTTIYGHQFDWNSFGTITVNPTNGEVAIVFADRGTANPNASEGCAANPQPPLLDPCRAGPGSDTNVYLVRSRDGGRTWGPRELVDDADGRSQWFPWAAYRPDGRLVVAWDEDTRPAPADDTLHVLWQDGHRQVLNALGPDHPDASVANWVGQAVPKDQWPAVCGPAGYTESGLGAAEGKDCTVFLGNYSGLAIDSVGRVHVTWTGSSQFVTSPLQDPYTGGPHDGYRQTAMYARR